MVQKFYFPTALRFFYKYDDTRNKKPFAPRYQDQESFIGNL